MPLTLARRPRLIAGTALCAVAALAVAGWTFAPRGTSALASRSGPRLAIAVVPPVEPAIDPGGVLDVGTLNDGFDRAVLDRPPVVDDPTLIPAEAYVGEPSPVPDVPRMPPPTPVAFAPAAGPVPVKPGPDPLADGSRVFGFDRPGPDYSAERDARARAAESPLEWIAPPASPPVPAGDDLQGGQ